jgi:hypothetical protein
VPAPTWQLELKDEKVNVVLFSEDYAALQDVPIASICKVWENPKTGEFLRKLVLHEALYLANNNVKSC